MSQTDPQISTENSYFDGNFWQRLGWIIVSRFLTVITLGLAYPAAVCMLLRWECKHTVINGRRLKFTGKGAQLFGKYILWWLLTVVTFGIFGIWLGLNMKKWTVKHTVYADDNTGAVSRFTGGVGGYIGIRLLAGLLTVCTFGIGAAWGKRMIINWEFNHTYISGTHLGFTGRGGQLFGKYILWGFLSIITFSIFALFIPIKFLKWQYKHVGATPVEEVPGEKKAGVGVIIAVIGAGLAVLLIIGVVIALFFPKASISFEPNRGEASSSHEEQVMFVLNDANMLAPTLEDAQQLPGNFESCVDYEEIQGQAFSFALDSAILPEDMQNYTWTQEYFTASGKIGTTAYLDTDADILYLDYGVESAGCPTYLCLDGNQTGTGHAAPLTKLITDNDGIHSVAYPYDTAPEYVYIMTLLHTAGATSNTGETDPGEYYFVVLHKQYLNVTVSTADDPSDNATEQNSSINNGSLAGNWIGCSKAPYDTSAPDGTPATGMTCLHWNIEADGTFTAYYMGYGNFGSGFIEMYNPVKHIGTWELSGDTLTICNEYIDYPAEDPDQLDNTVESYTVRIENGKLIINGHPDCSTMLKDADAKDVYAYVTDGTSGQSESSSDLVGKWVILGEPRANTVSGTAETHFADGGYYTFHSDGTFHLETIVFAKHVQDSWYHMGGGEKAFEGTYQYDGTTLTLHYTTTYKSVWNDATQAVESQPVVMDETEQIQVQLNPDGMTAEAADSPRFGTIAVFQKPSTDIPIDDILTILKEQY